ncbi:MAG TPA: hypothetical protein VF540_04480 [Segetibacter sp.]
MNSIMILDSRMKIIKANRALLHLFEISDAPLAGSRLSDLHHPFLSSAEIKKEIISNIGVTQERNKLELKKRGSYGSE